MSGLCVYPDLALIFYLSRHPNVTVTHARILLVTVTCA
jgi:hypothetical protein